MALTKASTPHIAHIIDPHYYQENSRAEFRLSPNTAYFSDMRLINVGISSGTNTEYNGLLGAEASIRSIALMDGGVTIEALNQAQFLRAWKKLQSTNSGNIDIGRFTTYNSVGYLANGRVNLTTGNYGEGEEAEIVFEQEDTVSAAGTEAQAWISLRDVFPFLESTPVIPTNVFKDLRVVVEYSSARDLQNLVKNSTLADLKTSRPLLLAEELSNTEIKTAAMSNYQGSKWYSWEHEQFRLDALANPPNTTDATAVGDQVAVTQKLRAFTGKYLQEMVIQCSPTLAASFKTGNDNDLFGKYGSTSLFRPQFNVRINGASKIPREGLIGKNRRLAVVSDVLGNWNVPSFQVYTGQFSDTKGIEDRLATSVGQADFTAVDIEDNCQDVQLTVRRSAAHDQNNLNQAINVQVWGHVSKALIVSKNGTYVIVNATE